MDRRSPPFGPVLKHLLLVRRHAAAALGVTVALTTPLALWLSAVSPGEEPSWSVRLLATALYVGAVAAIQQEALGVEGSQRAWHLAGLGGVVGAAIADGRLLTSPPALLVASGSTASESTSRWCGLRTATAGSS